MVILRLMPPPRAVLGIKHGVAAGQRQIGGQRRALVAALFLDHLHQHHLAALDDFLDLVLAARAECAFRNFFQHVVAADGFDEFFLGIFLAVVLVVFFARSGRGLFAVTGFAGFLAGVRGMGGVIGVGAVFLRLLFGRALGLVRDLDARLGCGEGYGFFHDGNDRLGRRRRGGLDSRRRLVVGMLVIVMVVAIVSMVMLVHGMIMRLVLMMLAMRFVGVRLEFALLAMGHIAFERLRL